MTAIVISYLQGLAESRVSKAKSETAYENCARIFLNHGQYHDTGIEAQWFTTPKRRTGARKVDESHSWVECLGTMESTKASQGTPYVNFGRPQRRHRNSISLSRSTTQSLRSVH